MEHYLAIDVGGSKTLFAVFEASGELICEVKIKTASNYSEFKTQMGQKIDELKKQYSFSHCCCAVPGLVDIQNGVGIRFGNLTEWKNIPIKKDLNELLPNTRVLIHNDAKLAGLGESILLHKRYRKVLYLTISTGIGGGIIINDVIDPDFASFEPGNILVEFDGREQEWEDVASGKALKTRYGKMASEINDTDTWKEYAKSLVAGFEDLLATIQPDVVVIGGGVGAHFEKFQPYLEEELKKFNNPLVPTPPLLKAQRPEEAVIYGCYDYIKQNL